MKRVIRKYFSLPSRLLFHQLRRYSLVLKEDLRPAKKFFIYGTGRSGSKLLVSLLNSHPDIYCDCEILAKKYVSTAFFPYLYMDALSRKAKLKGSSVYGCKIMSYQLKGQKYIDDAAFIRNLSEKGWKFIHIRRENILDIVLSLMLAKKDNIWELRNINGYKQQKLYVDPVELINRIKYFKSIFKMEDRNMMRTKNIRIVYERDLLSGNWQAVMDSVFEYLGVEKVKVHSDLKKKFNGSYRDKIINFDEIKKVLSDHQLNGYLNREKFVYSTDDSIAD
jgi:LPS sulfotransferase NodH